MQLYVYPCLFLSFLDWISYISCWIQSHYAFEGDFEFMIFLIPPLNAEITDNHTWFGQGWTVNQDLHVLEKHSTN